MAKKKKTRLIGRQKTQKGKPSKSLKQDRQRRALPPGKRKTAKGFVYSERRPNRSDVKRKKRL